MFLLKGEGPRVAYNLEKRGPAWEERLEDLQLCVAVLMLQVDARKLLQQNEGSVMVRTTNIISSLKRL